MDSSALFHGLIDQTKHYDFLMCNPPFYSDTYECQGITNTRKPDRPSANSINTAADVESIYDQVLLRMCDRISCRISDEINSLIVEQYSIKRILYT